MRGGAGSKFGSQTEILTESLLEQLSAEGNILTARRSFMQFMGCLASKSTEDAAPPLCLFGV